MERTSLRRLVFAAGAPLAAAGVGSIGSRSAPQVYERLDKPAWAPPAGVFGPVWTALYAAIALHAGQLALNAVWPFAFFAVRNRAATALNIAVQDPDAA